MSFMYITKRKNGFAFTLQIFLICLTVAATNAVADDLDGDGLSDQLEISLGTDINNPDTDGDGLLDGFEYEYRLATNVSVVFYKAMRVVTSDYFTLDPLDASDALSDTDGDGVKDGVEALNGLNPI